MNAGPELALGTAQFGLKYGIAGRGEVVPPAEVRRILSVAWEGGIRLLDTAPVYGDIEARLSTFIEGFDYTVISKIPPLPKGANQAEAAAFVREGIARAQERLDGHLGGLLFHHANDLLGPYGDAVWSASADVAHAADLKLGVSCYSPEDALTIVRRFPLTIAQLPGNAFDQRLESYAFPTSLGVHLRSVFLQGLLLLSPREVAARLPRGAAPAQQWARWCAEQGLTRLQAALCLAKGFSGASHCIVGVDSTAQLEEILSAWGQAKPLRAEHLAVSDQDVIDPRKWRAV
jgi:aryl-alcohol dehydrogenase-like predicted oxidoreductase